MSINYNRVIKDWNYRIALLHIDKRKWQIVSVVLLIISSILTFGFVNLSLRTQVVPHIIEVDNLGRAVFAGEPKAVTNNDLIYRAFLYRFVNLTRSVISDRVVMENNLKEAYQMAAPDVQRNILNEHFKKNDPFEIYNTISKQAVPVSFLKQSENTYIVEWEEVIRNKDLKYDSKEKWKALFVISKNTPTKKSLHDNPFNPFGIKITNISWSQL